MDTCLRKGWAMKKRPRNLSDLLRSKVPQHLTPEDLRELAAQLLIDRDDDPDPQFKRLKIQLDTLKFLHESIAPKENVLHVRLDALDEPE